jgi:hypothetical protein
MTIEFFTVVVTLFALLVAGLGSFVSESKRWKRGLAVVTGVIGLTAALTLLESSERSREKDQKAGEIERNWIRMAASDVLGWQFELVVDRGFLRLKEALPFLQKMKFGIEGTGADDPPNFAQDFSTVFTIENISKSGLFGDPAVKFAKNEHGSEYPREVECVASGYGSRAILAGPPKMEADGRDIYVCSIRVSVILPQHGPVLTDLLKGKRISLTIPSEAPKCAGPCRDIFVGVRAIVPPPDDVDEPLIEISPMILARRPASKSAGLITYSLPGDGALELAKSSCKDTFGYADVESFPLTTGFFHRWYVTLTSGHEIVTVRDSIWATTTRDADLRGGSIHLYGTVPNCSGCPTGAVSATRGPARIPLPAHSAGTASRRH